MTNKQSWEENFYKIIDADGLVENEIGNLDLPSNIIKSLFNQLLTSKSEQMEKEIKEKILLEIAEYPIDRGIPSVKKILEILKK